MIAPMASELRPRNDTRVLPGEGADGGRTI
ncbi:hypothetical protein NRB56_51590 [Nocardia sp. RB56]|uniref:Uncharacterized protein n=1 Tax=Nocardia aurantia TaxID=2585199 RepID=A0A7K0DVH1_9NOCA|nr:hypothetical protein [Nocardia aurantia]